MCVVLCCVGVCVECVVSFVNVQEKNTHTLQSNEHTHTHEQGRELTFGISRRRWNRHAGKMKVQGICVSE